MTMKLAAKICLGFATVAIVSSVGQAQQIIVPSESTLAVIRVIGLAEGLYCKLAKKGTCDVKYNISERVYDQSLLYTESAVKSDLLVAYVQYVWSRSPRAAELSFEGTVNLIQKEYELNVALAMCQSSKCNSESSIRARRETLWTRFNYQSVDDQMLCANNPELKAAATQEGIVVK